MEDAAEYFAPGLLESRRRRVAVPDYVRERAPAAGLAGLREPRGSQRLRALGGKGFAHRSAMASRGLRHAARERSGRTPGARMLPTADLATSISRAGTRRRSGLFCKARAHSASPTWWATDGSGRPPCSRPFPGFEPFEFYPGYSANFFDGEHYVMKGGSARTAGCMLRRSFRNWFQPHYQYVYAGFRCVRN